MPVSISGNGSVTGIDQGFNVVGVLTASGGFSGNLTGNINATGVSTIATLNVTQSNPTNLNVSGVTTTATLRATSIVGVTTAGITTAYIGAVNDGPLAGFRNFIINGDMAISQRGTSFTDINTYTVDRWRTFGGPITFTVTQQDSIATYSPSRYAIRFARNSGQTQTNDSGIAQGIETRNSYALRGKKVTISFKARCGANYSAASSTLLARVFTGTGTDENPVSMTSMNADISQSVTLTTSLQSFSVTGTLSSSLTQATLTFSYTPTGTAGANDWFEVTDVQLEIGDRATPFERRSYGQELALCQRYYYNTMFINGADSYTAPTTNYMEVQGTRHRVADVTGYQTQVIFHPVIMRSSPNITLYNPNNSGTSAQVALYNFDGTVANSTAVSAQKIRPGSFALWAYTGVTVGTAGMSLISWAHWAASSEL
jgi:hypothetical protein